jgi:Fungal specific transcription factor domain
VQTRNSVTILFPTPTSLSLSVIDVAFDYFFNTCIPGSALEYIPGMLDDLCPTQCFISSTRAVAVAYFARERKDKRLMDVARSIYLRAIKQTNVALKSEAVNLNSTVVATMLLGLYEAMVLSHMSSQNSQSSSSCLYSWNTHMNGTWALLKFRGMEFLQTDLGKKIYFQVANKIRSSYSQQLLRPPPDFFELDQQMAPLMEEVDVTVKFWGIVDLVTELRVMEVGKEVVK